MEETQELKRIGFIGYRLEDGIYSMVDFESDEILDTMEEVSILYDGTVLLKHGHPDKINWRSKYLRDAYNKADPSLGNNIQVFQGKFAINELDKILTLTGYMPKYP